LEVFPGLSAAQQLRGPRVLLDFHIYHLRNCRGFPATSRK
jgi:hypothetical protein